MQTLASFNQKHLPKNRFGELRPGWTVRIHQKVREGDKAKSQVFEGIIIAHKHGQGPGGTITVRRVVGGFGVEKTLPIHLPSIEKIDVIRKSNVGRAKLYYLREKSAKEIRKKTRLELVKLAGKTESMLEVIE